MKKLALLPVLLALAACRQTPTHVHIDPALATIVPPDTKILMGARLDKLRETEIYRKYFATAKFAPLDEFEKRTGLNARKDLWELLVASNGKDAVILGRGRFSEGELEPRLQAEGAERFSYRGRNLYGNQQAAVTFLNMSTWIVGPTAAVKRLLDEQNSGKLGIPSDMKGLVESIPYQSQFWAVYGGGGVDLGFSQGSALGNANRMIRSIQTGTFSANLNGGIDMKAAGTCDTDQNAKQVHDALKAIAGIGRLSTPADQPDLLKVWDAIIVVQDQQSVRVQAMIPMALIDKFVPLLTR
jgi:hypothetical protein